MLQSPRPSCTSPFPYAATTVTGCEPAKASAFRGYRTRFSSKPDEYQTIRNRNHHQLHDDDQHQQRPMRSSRSPLLLGVATLLQSGSNPRECRRISRPNEFIGRKRAFDEQTHDDEQQTQHFWESNESMIPAQSCSARYSGSASARVHPFRSKNVAMARPIGTSHASPNEYLNVPSSQVDVGASSIPNREEDSGRRAVTLTPQYPSQNSHVKPHQRCFPSIDNLATARTRNTNEVAAKFCTDATTPTPFVPPLHRKTSISSSSTTSSSFEDDMSVDRPQHMSLKPRSAPPSQRKNSRYLHEIDHRVILSRIARGEKQSTLAKEFQVSCAAIYKLNKHREDVWLRRDENPLAKHPKKPRAKPAAAMTTTTAPPPAPAMTKLTSDIPSSPPIQNKHRVYEVKSRSVTMLFTMVRARNVALTECRRYADRSLRLVLEDALSLAPVERLQEHFSEHKHAPCGIALHPSGTPMLEMFHLTEPQQPKGCIRHRSSGDSNIQPLSLAFHSQVSTSSSPTPLLYQHNVFLFDIAIQASDSEALVDAVALLVHHQGAVESRIWVVTFSIAAATITRLHTTFPRVNIVTVHADTPTMSSSIHDVMNNQSLSKSLEVDMLIARFDKLYSPSSAIVSSLDIEGVLRTREQEEMVSCETK
ncbi:putative uracil phosphoribosyltransferase, partial [Globisporangium splendens]